MNTQELLFHFYSNSPRLIFSIQYKLDLLRDAGHDIRSRIDPEDILQDTYITAQKRAYTLYTSDPVAVRSWLRSIASNHLFDEVKKHVDAEKRSVLSEICIEKFRTPSRNDIGIPMSAQRRDGRTPSLCFEQASKIEEVYKLLDHVKPEEKQALLLFHIEERPYREIGEIMNLTLDDARALVLRAKKDFHRLILKNGKDFPNLSEFLAS